MIYSIGEGMPTGPDVDAILRDYPPLQPGDLLQKDKLYALLNLNPGQELHRTRLRTIMAALERKVRAEKALCVVYERESDGWRVALSTHVTARTTNVLRSIARKSYRQKRNLMLTLPTTKSESERMVAEHQIGLMTAMNRHARKDNLNLLPDMSVQQPPQRKYPELVGNQ